MLASLSPLTVSSGGLRVAELPPTLFGGSFIHLLKAVSPCFQWSILNLRTAAATHESESHLSVWDELHVNQQSAFSSPHWVPRRGPASFHFKLQLIRLDPAPADTGCAFIIRTSAGNGLFTEEHDGSVIIYAPFSTCFNALSQSDNIQIIFSYHSANNQKAYG